MRRTNRDVIAKLVQKHGRNGLYLRGTLEGGNVPVVLLKSAYEKNKRGEAVWNLYIDQ